MGRQAYLTRLALGRSIFEAPIKDENGDFVVGAGARVNDDTTYHQEWDDRGHPHNEQSEDAATGYRKAQNEVLEACGVLVKRDAVEQARKENAKRASETALVLAENHFGMIMKGSDRILGILLTWWSVSLRRRLMTYESRDVALTSLIYDSLGDQPVGFLFAGIALHIPALIVRYLRYCLADPDPFELVDHLQFNEDVQPPSLASRLRHFGNATALFMLELPMDAASVLDSLGYPLTVIASYARHQHPLVLLSLMWTNYNTWLPLVVYKHARDYIACQLGWRLFSVFEQCFTQPRYPSSASVRAADGDDLVDRNSIPGIGRPCSHRTQRRFVGTTDFWVALSTAFPRPGWTRGVQAWDKELEMLRFYILQSIALYELKSRDNIEFDNARALMQVRIASIVSLLEEAHIQVEHDKFIDLDKWAEEVDDHIDILRERATLNDGQTGRDEIDDILARARSREVDVITQPEDSQGSNSAIAGTEVRSEMVGQRHAGGTVLSSRRASTPQLGIRRAVSLSGNALESRDIDAQRSWSPGEYTMQDCIRQCYQRYQIHGPPQRGRGIEHRVTRTSVFAASSFAWHASSILTGIALIPFESGICRLIASRAALTFGMPKLYGFGPVSIIGIGDWFGRANDGIWGKWRYTSMLALIFGLESLLRFGMWRTGVGFALHKAESFRWGRF